MTGTPKISVAAGIATAAALVVIVAALVTLGSPAQARQRRLDDLRAGDLATLSSAVDQYWRKRGTLPENLDSLVAARFLGELPADPTTNARYRFQVTGADAYRLCATFALASNADQLQDDRRLTNVYDLAHAWRHTAGESCFDLKPPAKVDNK